MNPQYKGKGMAKQLLLSLFLSTVCNSVRKPRNIIVLLGDDIGWNEVSESDLTTMFLSALKKYLTYDI